MRGPQRDGNTFQSGFSPLVMVSTLAFSTWGNLTYTLFGVPI